MQCVALRAPALPGAVMPLARRGCQAAGLPAPARLHARPAAPRSRTPLSPPGRSARHVARAAGDEAEQKKVCCAPGRLCERPRTLPWR